MDKYPNTEALAELVNEIEDLKQAKRLLEELWFSTNAEDCVKSELSDKVNNYFGVTP